MIVFSNFIKNKYNKDDLTFEELFKLTKKNLLIIGTNYTTQTEEVFSYDTTPNMSILIALRISISVPILFTPVLYNTYYYVDGCLVNNFPIDHCNIATTLGLNIIFNNNNIKNNKIDDIFTLLKNSIKIIMESINKHKKINNNNIIKIENILDNNFMIGVGYNVCYDIVSSVFDEIKISLNYKNLFDKKTNRYIVLTEYKNK